MAVQSFTSSESAFGESALVVSGDQALASTLSGFLRRDHGCRAELVESFQDAETALRRSPLNSTFLDLRTNDDSSPAPLLRLLGQQNGNRMPVIAIAQHGYVCQWADLADWAVDGHLSLPLDRDQIARLSKSPIVSSRITRSAGPRIIRGKTQVCETYTPEMFQMLEQLVMMAAHAVTILLVGDTGTGKTTLAKLVHDLSPRSDKRFLTVACGALPGEIIESELFGHVKGAFTGADQDKIGKFAAAEDGTLLLDEIDVLGPNQQAKLLRVIETGEYEPVGSNETRRSRARVIAASNVNLKALVEREQFRSDLYFRLNVMEFRIPSLHRRPLDIVPLTMGFVEETCVYHGVAIRRIHPNFLACLKSYDWPGNIRELKNHVQRAVLFCKTGELTLDDLAPSLLKAEYRPHPFKDAARADSTLLQQVASTEREILEAALKANDNNRTETAKALGISRVGLYKKLNKYGITSKGKDAAQADAG